MDNAGGVGRRGSRGSDGFSWGGWPIAHLALLSPNRIPFLEDVFHPRANVLFTLIGFAGMYLIMGLLYVLLLAREAEHGPQTEAPPPGLAESLTSY